MMTDRVRYMNNGLAIPTIGLRTNKNPNEYQTAGEVEEAVKLAIDIGYRHFDCAWVYGTEREVGRAINSKIAEKKIKREDVFITTKLWNNFHEKGKVIEMLVESLDTMNLLYVDLFLMHWPMGFKKEAPVLPSGQEPEDYSDVDYLETWHAMEECLHLGYTKSIGVANFNTEQIQRLLLHTCHMPAVNQIEVSLHFNQKPVIEFCKRYNILVIGYCPFGLNEITASPRFPETPINPNSDALQELERIAQKYNKTPPQIVLKYLISLGICVVPRSRSIYRLKEYFDIFDFVLKRHHIKKLESYNRNERVCAMKAYVDHQHYPFERTFSKLMD